MLKHVAAFTLLLAGFPIQAAAALPAKPAPAPAAYDLPEGTHLISIPLKKGTPIKLEGLPKGARFEHWDAAKRRFMPADRRAAAPGRGYRVILPEAAKLAARGAMNAGQSVEIPLAAGDNLIGAPFDADTPWRAITVLRGDASMSLETAMDRGFIHTVESETQVRVPLAVGMPLERFKGYAVLAGEAGLRLRIQRVPPLQAPPLAWAAFKFLGTQLGSAVANKVGGYFIGQALSAIGFPDATGDKLAELGGKMDEMLESQKRIEAQLTSLAGQVQISEVVIKRYVQDNVYLKDVVVGLKTHYDDPTPNQSLAYYKDKYKGGTTADLNAAGLDQFANNVLTTWGFPALFNNVAVAIQGDGGSPGLFDLWADEIILRNDNTVTLMQQYQAMEAYFLRLVSMQQKIQHLMVESYNRLGGKPGYTVGLTDAKYWVDNVYAPAMAKGADSYLRAVEKIVIARADLSRRRPGQDINQQRFLPPIAGDILARADFFAAQSKLEDPTGLYGRTITSILVTPARSVFYRMVGGAAGYSIVTVGDDIMVQGPVPYASFVTTAIGGQFGTDFTVSRLWKVNRFRVVGGAPAPCLATPATYTFLYPVAVAPNPEIAIPQGCYNDNFEFQAADARYNYGNVVIDRWAGFPEVFSVGNNAWSQWEDTYADEVYARQPLDGVAAAAEFRPDSLRRYLDGPFIARNNWMEIRRRFKYIGTPKYTANFAATADAGGSYSRCWNGGQVNGEFQRRIYLYGTTAGRTLLDFWQGNGFVTCQGMLEAQNPSIGGAVTLTYGSEYYFGMYIRMNAGAYPAGNHSPQANLMLSLTGVSLTGFQVQP